MEPHYECRLCPNQGQANHMFNHLLGRGHREKYFENKYDIQPENTGPYQIQKMAESEQENEKTELITTIYSDELYPWLSGKAPWSLEQGKMNLGLHTYTSYDLRSKCACTLQLHYRLSYLF